MILVGLLVSGLATWMAWPSKNGQTPLKVETRKAKVERGPISLSVTATGDIRPVRQVELKSKASGMVVRFQKNAGDPVQEGELIVELDKRVEQRNLSLQEANLLTAEANLANLRLKAESDLKTVESECAAAAAEEKQKKDEFERLEKLSGELLTKTEMETARLAARLAEERRKQAEAVLGLTRGRRAGDEKLAQADVLKARVSVEDAQERLKDTELRSPVKGILLKKLVEEGQIVASGISATAGGTAIAVVADVSTLYVEANVDETDVLKLKKGQGAEVALVSGSTDRFKGRVELIPPQSELDSNIIVFKVRVALEEGVFGRAYVGMTASVSILVAERKEALLVPSEAVRIEGRKRVVYVPEGEGSKPVTIKVGLDNGVKTEVLEGLPENAEVYVTHTSLPDPKQGSRGRSMRF